MEQGESIMWLAKKHEHALGVPGAETLNKLFKRYGIDSQKIQRRYFEIPDQVVGSPLHSHIYSDHLPPKGMGHRMNFFRERSIEVFEELYCKSSTTPPDHMIHVTCTGYVSPSPAQVFVDKKGWEVPITHAYHMGCYAAMPAIRMADAFLQNSTAINGVDIIHTEMCSLHMDSTAHSPEQMVVQSLFADGHIKYSVVVEKKSDEKGFTLLAVKESLIPKTTQMMSWVPMDWGIAMTLSREVPNQIRDHIKPFVQNLCAAAGLELGSVLKKAIFAIHPGGPKIIDAVHDILELSNDQSRASREVLLERGNMSSATLPHVWEKLSHQNLNSGQIVVSLAFGPGLTVFGSVFIYG
jgi:predicted naringenin-chalcone synthase